ncbi:interleukin-6 [Pleurodeles waltl]
MESLMENNLDLPRINKEDGCFHKGFKTETCLRKITSSLVGFETYLSYIEETFGSDSQKVESIKHKTKHLAESLMHLINKPNAEAVTAVTQVSQKTKPQSKEVWTQRVTARLILRDFIVLIQKTVRAVRFLGTSDDKKGSTDV